MGNFDFKFQQKKTTTKCTHLFRGGDASKIDVNSHEMRYSSNNQRMLGLLRES